MQNNSGTAERTKTFLGSLERSRRVISCPQNARDLAEKRARYTLNTRGTPVLPGGGLCLLWFRRRHALRELYPCMRGAVYNTRRRQVCCWSAFCEGLEPGG
ncbi:hypothetical protein M404DRAFT_860174 [Pisolithus tinctorius Marx 270]|uniref:Uncharacterized protein n=1 Tax=Pisolithus tinctorius Marx 270 TaxID=870435 RepID=A0A0C3NRT5_PISTI|nr:hypothetical protein M404DRAFT_860174 [Pisolithus tinctorius Marx 270]